MKETHFKISNICDKIKFSVTLYKDLYAFTSPLEFGSKVFSALQIVPIWGTYSVLFHFQNEKSTNQNEIKNFFLKIGLDQQ